MLNLDSFLLSLLCVVFTLVGQVIADTVCPPKGKRDWGARVPTILTIGMGFYFGESLLPKDLQSQNVLALACAIGGAIGAPLIRIIVNKPTSLWKLWKELKSLDKDDKDKK